MKATRTKRFSAGGFHYWRAYMLNAAMRWIVLRDMQNNPLNFRSEEDAEAWAFKVYTGEGS